MHLSSSQHPCRHPEPGEPGESAGHHRSIYIWDIWCSQHTGCYWRNGEGQTKSSHGRAMVTQCSTSGARRARHKADQKASSSATAPQHQAGRVAAHKVHGHKPEAPCSAGGVWEQCSHDVCVPHGLLVVLPLGVRRSAEEGGVGSASFEHANCRVWLLCVDPTHVRLLMYTPGAALHTGSTLCLHLPTTRRWLPFEESAPTHTGKSTGVAVSHCITRFQTQPILMTCQIRYHSHVWDHRSTGQL